MFGKNEDVRKKTDLFFKFFTDFINDVEKSLPKEEKKPTKKAKAGNDKKANHAAMMAELAMKMKK